MSVTNLIPRIRSRIPGARGTSAGRHPLVNFQERMNRLFDDLWHDVDMPESMSLPSVGLPRMDMSETGQELKIEAELPGLDEKDVEVFLQDGSLTIRGEKFAEKEQKDTHVSERYYGKFERLVSLPVQVREDQVRASFKKGVLTITLPKVPGTEPRAKRIPISSQ